MGSATAGAGTAGSTDANGGLAAGVAGCGADGDFFLKKLNMKLGLRTGPRNPSRIGYNDGL